MVKQIQNFKLQIQPLGRLSDHFNPDLDLFQGINLVFRETIYERDQTMYNYIVSKLQNVKLRMQYMVKFLDLKKVHDRNQTMLQNPKLQMQPQAVTVSHLSLYKVYFPEDFCLR